jgi:hypothetical protein
MNLCPVALSSSVCRNLASGAAGFSPRLPSGRLVIGTLLCILACLGAVLLAFAGLVYLSGVVLWMHAPLVPALLVCAGLMTVPGLLCVGCYRLGQRLRRRK